MQLQELKQTLAGRDKFVFFFIQKWRFTLDNYLGLNLSKTKEITLRREVECPTKKTQLSVKGTQCLGSVEWVFEKRL